MTLEKLDEQLLDREISIAINAFLFMQGIITELKERPCLDAFHALSSFDCLKIDLIQTEDPRGELRLSQNELRFCIYIAHMQLSSKSEYSKSRK